MPDHQRGRLGVLASLHVESARGEQRRDGLSVAAQRRQVPRHVVERKEVGELAQDPPPVGRALGPHAGEQLRPGHASHRGPRAGATPLALRLSVITITTRDARFVAPACRL